MKINEVEFQPLTQIWPNPDPGALSFSTYFRNSSTVVALEVKMPSTPMEGEDTRNPLNFFLANPRMESWERNDWHDKNLRIYA